jgi:hypothetical protein
LTPSSFSIEDRWFTRACSIGFEPTSLTSYSQQPGYQLWLPDDHGHKDFGAVRGYGGQDIFVARDLNLVVIFTGSTGFPERNAKDIRLLLKDVILPGIR